MIGDLCTCPCCGYKSVFDEHDICAICFWQNDYSQNAKPDSRSGPNHVTLREAQKNFIEFGACEPGAKLAVRTPIGSDIKDPNWSRLPQLKE